MTQIWFNIVSTLLPGGTKSLPEPVLTYKHRCSSAFTCEQLNNMCLEITLLRLLLHLSWVNVLNSYFNTLKPRQNGCYFPDDIFNVIFLNKNVCISIKISLKCPTNNIQALFQLMAWRRPGDKPLSEPMMV